MPFTLAHPAAVLPFRKRMDFLALAIGAMVVDLGYYFAPIEYFRESAHTLWRSFSFCLPMGLLVYTLARFLRPGFEKLLPGPFKIELSFKPLWLVPPSLLIGSWTHILWDSFTHRNGFVVALLPILQTSLGGGFYLFHQLQHLSTLLGLGLLFRCYSRYLRLSKQDLRWEWRYGMWGALLLLSALPPLYGLEWPNGMPRFRAHVFHFLVGLLGNFSLLVAIFSLIARLNAKRSGGEGSLR